MEPTKGMDTRSEEWKWSAEGIDDPKVEASLKAAIISVLDAEVAKGAWPSGGPKVPTGFPKEIKIDVLVKSPGR
jgi:hypothetical protein